MGHHLVRFYDSSKSWYVSYWFEDDYAHHVFAVRQWVELDQLLLLGESDGERIWILHDLILAEVYVLQSWTNRF